jgi:uncharacterized protein YwqG
MPLTLDQLREKLGELIDANGLTPRKAQILGAAKPSIELLLDGEGRGGAGKLSYIGGMPNLPEDVPWPARKNGHPLSHIAQIHLPGIAPLLEGNPLPSSGLLNFFSDMDNCWGGRRHDEKDGWKVIYTPENRIASSLKTMPPVPPEVQQKRLEEIRESRRKLVEGAQNASWVRTLKEPALPELTLPRCAIHFVQALTIPAFRSIEILSLELDDGSWDAYGNLRDALGGLISSSSSIHRMFGHPDAIQGCMQRTAQFTTNAAYLPKGVYSYYEHPRAAELMPGSHDWQLLFQLDSNRDPSWMWGDDGKLFFWIRREDLRALAFEKAWYFLQCH